MTIDKSKWKKATLGSVVSHSTQRSDPDSGEVLRFVAGEHMESDELRINKWGNIGDGYLGPAFTRRFFPGDVLYGSRRTYLRKLAVSDFDGICANTTLVLNTSNEERLLQDFLPVVMTTEAFHSYSVKESKGSVNPYVNWSDLAKYEFLLPPIDQQQELALLFWSLQKHKEILKSALLSMEKNIDAVLQTHLNRISLNSGNIQLAQICEVNPPVLGVTSESPFIEMADVEEWGYWANFSSEKGTRGGIKANAGDLLVARITPCLENGKIGRVPFHLERVGGSTEFLVVRSLGDIDQDYLMMLLTLPSFHNSLVHSMVGSTGRQRLSADTLRQLLIPDCSSDEKAYLTKLWVNFRKSAEAFKDEIASIQNMIFGISRDYMTGDN